MTLVDGDGQAIRAGWRAVGVDIGGTFTDVVLLGDTGVVIHKTLSTPTDYSEAVITGIRVATREASVELGSLDGVVHATTVVTNTLLEHKGARTGMIVTKGFRDVLEIGRLRRPSMYDLDWVKPDPLVPRELRLEVEERVAASGDIVTGLDEREARAVVATLIDQDVASIAVCLLNSYLNGEHELQIAGIVQELAPRMHVSLSSRVLPAIREFERWSTTVVNAYVAPVATRYVERLHDRLRDLGIQADESHDMPLMLMQSNGGVVPSRVAADRPVTLVESGPAAGAMAGVVLAHQRESQELIGLDIGGTTAKAFLVERGRLRETGQMEIGVGMNAESRLFQGGGYTVAVPSIDLAEVGAGGGSIARIDSGGALKVGPQSAGADPGPACYGRGGELPTVTDSFAVLGFLGSEGIAGGTQPIAVDLARAVIEKHIAAPLGLSVDEAAWGIHRLNTAAMIRAVRAVTTERGRDPRGMEILTFGGAGPVQAAEVLRQLGARGVVVPPLPGVFSGFGLLLADLSFDFQAPVMRSTKTLTDAGLAERFADLRATALAELATMAIDLGDLEVEWGLEMRYEGQSSELAVHLPPGASVAQAIAAFETEHEETYGHRSPDELVDFVAIRFRARRPGGHGAYADLIGLMRQERRDRRDLPASRLVFFEDRRWDTPIIQREDLGATAREGPLIVAEYDSTIVVPPGMTAVLDGLSNVIIHRPEG